MKKFPLFILILAFGLRLFRAGQPVFKEDEFTSVKAAAYIYYCQNNQNQCYHQSISLKNKALALITANETVPNLGAEIYLWDFIKDKASEIHHGRAWPHLYLMAGVYSFLGINEFASRLVSVVAGSLLVAAGYWFSRAMKSSINLSLLYSGLLAVSFPLIDFSRNARMYSLYGLVFLVLVGLIYKSKWWLALPLFILVYWLQMLTLILPVAILVGAVWTGRKNLIATLTGGFILAAGLSYYSGVDFFGTQFLGFIWPPHWQYLNWWWLAAIIVLTIKREQYLLSIIGVYLIVLIFFSKPEPGAAYLIALWPLSLWAVLNWGRWLVVVISVIILAQFGLGINYLYFGRDGRAEIPLAYEVIKKNFNPGDKIYAVQLRDYYLRDLPEDTIIIDLRTEPTPEFSGSGFIVWEAEKVRHLKAETLEYIQNNFRPLGTNGVEIYSFGK